MPTCRVCPLLIIFSADFHVWALRGTARPISVTAFGSDGVASQKLDRKMEDTITLAVQWENLADGSKVPPE